MICPDYLLPRRVRDEIDRIPTGNTEDEI